MMRLFGLWLGLLCALAVPRHALAQEDTDTGFVDSSGGLPVQLLFVDEQAYNPLQRIPFGKRACDRNVLLEFKVEGLTSGFNAARYIEVWKGTGCNLSENKDEVGDDDCDIIFDRERMQNQTYEEIDIQMGDICTEADGNVTLWFFPVDALNTNQTITTYGKYEIMLDLTPPDPPTNVRSGAGETEIPISWTPDGANIARNYLLWDPNPVSVGDVIGDASLPDSGIPLDAECASPHLLPGSELVDFDDLPRAVRTKEVEGAVSRATVSGDELGSDYVAMAIVAEDLAGNLSLMSEVTCVRVVPTDGFWDAYQGEGGEIQPGCACSAPGIGTGSLGAGGLLAVPAALGMLILRTRRKRQS